MKWDQCGVIVMNKIMFRLGFKSIESIKELKMLHAVCRLGFNPTINNPTFFLHKNFYIVFQKTAGFEVC